MDYENRTGLFLQIRLNSTRMPGKALLEMNGKPVLQHIMERFNVVPADVRVLLTTKDTVEHIRPLADLCGWDVFVGNSQNVLKRFVDAALHYRVENIIRATGDNPLLSSEIAIETLSLFKKKHADLAYLAPVPYGSGVEVLNTSALLEAVKNTEVPYDMEHVAPYIYQNTSSFRIITAPFHDHSVAREDVRITVDTRDDYEKVHFLFRELKRRHLNTGIANVIGLWDEVLYEKYKRLLCITAGGSSFGFGHLKRSFFITDRLRDDFQISYSIRNNDRKAMQMVKNHFYDYLPFDSLAEHCRENGKFDRVIVDARDTTPEQMRKIAAFGPVISIDDMGEGGQQAYINIRTLPSVKEKSTEHFVFNYDGPEYLFRDDDEQSTPASCSEEKSAGPDKKQSVLKKEAKISSILVSFGGSDPAELSKLVYGILKRFGYDVKVVLGPFTIKKIETDSPSDIVHAPDSLAPYINEADLIITSFGMTLMESLARQKPVILINPSDYHDRLSEEFGYPYLIKEDEFEKNFSSLKTQLEKKIALVEAAKKSTGPEQNPLEPFFKMPIGKKADSLLDTIRHASPTEVLCPYCCSFGTELIARSSLWNMFSCPKCGLLFIDSFKTAREYDPNYFITEYKEQYGKTYEEDRETIRSFAGRRLKIIQSYRPGKNLLDYGSGLGFFAELARENGFEPTCVDISDYAVSYMKEKLHLNAICSDQKALEQTDSKFDVITSFFLIEHIMDFEKLLFLFYQHLNPRGVLALSTPNAKGITIRNNFAEYSRNHPDDHYRIFSPSFLKKALRKIGFRNIKVNITGIHPGRMVKSKKILKNKAAVAGLKLYARLFGLGDTFEIYAQK